MAPKLTVVRPSANPGADLQPSDDGAPATELAPVFALADEGAPPGGKASPPGPATPLARQRLVELAMPMVEQCAREIARCFPALLKREDLLGPATVGMYEAIDKYREDRHPHFVGYAQHYIRHRILDSIDAEHWSLRARVERAMEIGFDRFSGHQIVNVNLFKDPVEQVVDGARQGGDEALAAAFFAGILEAQGASPEEAAMELQGQVTGLEHVRAALGTLHSHEREVIRLVYEEDKTLDEAAVKIGVSQKTAQRRHVSALRKLRACLVARGVTDARLLGR